MVTVTWDVLETRQADIEVPDDTPPQEVTRLAREFARRDGGTLVGMSAPGHVAEVNEPGGVTRFGGVIA